MCKSIVVGSLIASLHVSAALAQFPCPDPAWSAMGSGMSGSVLDLAVYALTTLPNGDLIAGGGFTTAGGVPAENIARWDGTSGEWSALGSGMNDFVGALTTLPNGDLIAGGTFTTAGGVPANRIARWDGTSGEWSALGLGMGGGSAYVGALTTLPNGDLIAGGGFTTAGGVLASRIARWDGTSGGVGVWSALGLGMNSSVFALTTLPNGDLIAGGSFITAGGVPVEYIARWDGTLGVWSTMGSGMNNYVYTLTTLVNGDLIAGGYLTTAGGVPANLIARWNGTAWSALGSGFGGFGSPFVYKLTTLANGDLIAGGYFTTTGGVPVEYIARWNETAWSALGSGMSGDNPTVRALTTLPNGDLIAGGDFTTAGGVPANRIARYGCPPPPPCYADCDASGGLDIDDFICFQTFFALGDLYADCDASGGLNIDDFICFQTAFAVGC